MKKNTLKKIKYEFECWITFLFHSLLSLMGRGDGAGKIRGFLLRLYGFKFGKKVCIRNNVRLGSPNDGISIGEGTGIGDNVYFDCTGEITLGKYCDIGFNNVFITSSHEIQSNDRTLRPVTAPNPITIEDYVWIGANCTIIGPITIGKGSVIGAGSVVNKDVPPGVLSAGVPAKIIRVISAES